MLERAGHSRCRGQRRPRGTGGFREPKRSICCFSIVHAGHGRARDHAAGPSTAAGNPDHRDFGPTRSPGSVAGTGLFLTMATKLGAVRAFRSRSNRQPCGDRCKLPCGREAAVSSCTSEWQCSNWHLTPKQPCRCRPASASAPAAVPVAGMTLTTRLAIAMILLVAIAVFCGRLAELPQPRAGAAAAGARSHRGACAADGDRARIPMSASARRDIASYRCSRRLRRPDPGAHAPAASIRGQASAVRSGANGSPAASRRTRRPSRPMPCSA